MIKFIKRLFEPKLKIQFEGTQGEVYFKVTIPKTNWCVLEIPTIKVDIVKLIQEFNPKILSYSSKFSISKSGTEHEDTRNILAYKFYNYKNFFIRDGYKAYDGAYNHKIYGDDIQLTTGYNAKIYCKSHLRDFVISMLSAAEKDIDDYIPKIEPKKTEVSYLVSNQSGLQLQTINLRDSGKYNPKDYNMNYSDEVHEQFDISLESMRQPGNGIHILHGPPGCGKTALIRKLITKVSMTMEDYKIIYFSPNLLANLGDASFTGWLIRLSENISGPIIFILEDTGEFIGSQNGDNRHPSTVAILNIIDGMLGEALFSYGIHIVVSYNNLEEVDSAILRTGRTITNLYIGELTAEHADAWCEHHNLKPLGMPMRLHALYDYLRDASSKHGMSGKEPEDCLS